MAFVVKTIEFHDTFIPDRPWANPYFGLDAYMGTDVSAQEHFTSWQQTHAVEVVSVTKVGSDGLLVAYRSKAHAC